MAAVPDDDSAKGRPRLGAGGGGPPRWADRGDAGARHPGRGGPLGARRQAIDRRDSHRGQRNADVADSTAVTVLGSSSAAITWTADGRSRHPRVLVGCAAREKGVKRVVKVSSITIGTAFQGGLTAVHAAAEAALSESGLDGRCFGQRRPWGPLLRSLTSTRVCSTHRAATPARPTARRRTSALSVCGSSSKAVMRGWRTLSPARSRSILSQVASILATEWGRPLRYQPMSDDDYSRLTEAAGIPRSVSDLSISFFQRVRAGAYAEVLQTVESLLERPGTSYRNWARINAMDPSTLRRPDLALGGGASSTSASPKL